MFDAGRGGMVGGWDQKNVVEEGRGKGGSCGCPNLRMNCHNADNHYNRPFGSNLLCRWTLVARISRASVGWQLKEGGNLGKVVMRRSSLHISLVTERERGGYLSLERKHRIWWAGKRTDACSFVLHEIQLEMSVLGYFNVIS